jgi:integrase
MAENKRSAEARWDEKGKRWKVNVQVNGVRKSFYSSTEGRRGKAECERKADAWVEANCPDNIRFGDAWLQYLAKVKAATGTGNYNNIEKYGRLYILPDLEKRKLSEVTVGHMEKCIEKVGQAGLSKRTCTNVRSAFVGFYRYCKKNNLPLVEPENLTIPTTAKVGSRTILQPEGLVTLFSKDTYSYYGEDVEARYVYAWRLIVVLGLRRGELCGLQQADRVKGILHIQRSINGSPPYAGQDAR